MTSHRLVTLFGGLAFASMGMNTAIVSFALLGMRAEWRLSPMEVSLVIASAGVGQLGGSVVLGNLSDSLGRKRTYALGVALQTGFTALAGLAPSLAAACAGLGAGSTGGWLLAAGIALGLAGQCIRPVCLTYAAEIYPPAVRGLGVGWALGAWGQLVALLPFCALTAAAAVVVTLAGPETAGQALTVQPTAKYSLPPQPARVSWRNADH